MQLTTVQACCWTPATVELAIDRNGGYYVNCVNQSGNSDYLQLYPDISALVGHWVDVIVGVHWTKDKRLGRRPPASPTSAKRASRSGVI